jgi:hypothetical protein
VDCGLWKNNNFFIKDIELSTIIFTRYTQDCYPKPKWPIVGHSSYGFKIINSTRKKRNIKI